MNTQRQRTITRTMVLAIAIASITSRGLAQEPPVRLNQEFFALDGIFDHAIVSDGGIGAFERTSTSAQLAIEDYGARSEAAASETADSDQPSTFAAAASRGNSSQLTPGIVERSFTARPFGEDDQGAAFKMLGVSMFVASGADLLSTEIGLATPGVVELNPTQQGRALRIGTHVATPALMWWLTDRVHRQGKPKLALFMRIGFAVAYSYAVMHNVRTMSTLP